MDDDNDDLSPADRRDEKRAREALTSLDDYIQQMTLFPEGELPLAASPPPDGPFIFYLPPDKFLEAVAAVRLPTSDKAILRYRDKHSSGVTIPMWLAPDAATETAFEERRRSLDKKWEEKRQRLQRCTISVSPTELRVTNRVKGIVCEVRVPLNRAQQVVPDHGIAFDLFYYQLDGLFGPAASRGVGRIPSEPETVPPRGIIYDPRSSTLEVNWGSNHYYRIEARPRMAKPPLPVGKDIGGIRVPRALELGLRHAGRFSRIDGHNPRFGVISVGGGSVRGGNPKAVSVYLDPDIGELVFNLEVRHRTIIRSILRRMKGEVRVAIEGNQILLASSSLHCSFEQSGFEFQSADALVAEVDSLDRYWLVNRLDGARPSVNAILPHSGRDMAVQLEFDQGNPNAKMRVEVPGPRESYSDEIPVVRYDTAADTRGSSKIVMQRSHFVDAVIIPFCENVEIRATGNNAIFTGRNGQSVAHLIFAQVPSVN